MPRPYIPGNPYQLDPDNRGVYIADLGGPVNGTWFGTDGNVTLEDVEEEAFPTWQNDSELEALLGVLADEAGVSEFQFANYLGRLGALTGADGGSPGYVRNGEVELDNAVLEVGDIVNLGDGHDRIFAGGGNDIVFGGTGDDQLRGQDGIDLLFGGEGEDRLIGGADGDLLSGGNGNDELLGGAGNDWLIGGAGDDLLDGGDGRDLMQAGDGADFLIPGDGGFHENLHLGTSPTSEDVLDRDDFTDTVRASATFADNGTDTVFQYSDGQFDTIARDIIDLSDTFDFSADADTAAEREAELAEAFHVLAPSNRSAEIRDLGGDGEIGGGDDNTWFVLHEDSTGSTAGGRPEIVTVELDGFTFEWNFSDGGGWVEI